MGRKANDYTVTVVPNDEGEGTALTFQEKTTIWGLLIKAVNISQEVHTDEKATKEDCDLPTGKLRRAKVQQNDQNAS